MSELTNKIKAWLLEDKAPNWYKVLSTCLTCGILIYLLVFGGINGVTCLRKSAIVSSCMEMLHPDTPCLSKPEDMQNNLTKVFQSDCFRTAYGACRSQNKIGYVFVGTTTTTILEGS